MIQSDILLDQLDRLNNGCPMKIIARFFKKRKEAESAQADVTHILKEIQKFMSDIISSLNFLTRMAREVLRIPSHT